MRIVIIGAGQVGSFLARNLSKEHDVVMIEKDTDTLDKIKDTLDVLLIHGDGDNPSILKEAKLGKADILLAVSGDDKANIMASFFGNSLGVSRIILRVRDSDYLDYPSILNRPDIHVVNPSEIISEKMKGLISSPFAWRTETFAMGRIQMYKLRVEEATPICEKKLAELGPATSWIFVALSRNGNITIPTGDTKLEAGDYIFALGIPSVLDKLMQLVGIEEEKVESAIVVGGGKVGRNTALALTDMGVSVKLIESNQERARAAAEELPSVIVFSGDASDTKVLKEAGVESIDYFIALTGDDENNVLSALLAKSLGAKRTTVLFTKPDYIDVIEKIGVDRAISVRLSVANEILSLLHIGGVAHVALVEEGKAEILEYEISESSKIIGVSFVDAKFPKGSIVGIVVRDDEVIVPRGDFTPRVNDRLIIFALPEALKKVEKLLG